MWIKSHREGFFRSFQLVHRTRYYSPCSTKPYISQIQRVLAESSKNESPEPALFIPHLLVFANLNYVLLCHNDRRSDTFH